MAVSRLHGLFGVSLGGTLLGGITRVAIPSNPDVRADASSAEVFARHAAVHGIDPTAEFTTLALQDALDVVGLSGVDIASLTGPPAGLILYAQKYLQGGGRAGATSHRSYTFAAGLVHPGALSVQHRDDATLTYSVLPVSADGAADPYAIADSVSLPAGIADNERFTLGQTTIGGVTIDHMRSLELDFGVQAAAIASDSDIYPTHASLRTVGPRLVLRGIDMEWLKAANVPLGGKIGAHTDTIVYLRKRTATGFVADGVAEHIKITLDGVAVIDNAFDASHPEPGETSLAVSTRFDGTLDPITIDTTSAIV